MRAHTLSRQHSPEKGVRGPIDILTGHHGVAGAETRTKKGSVNRCHARPERHTAVKTL